jgi:LacI family transcriptional regulator
MRYLIELGHRRIGFITGNLDMDCAHERLAGYREALADHDIPVDESLIAEGNFHRPLAFQRTRELLALANPPTAIFASNDVSAFGVMDAVRDVGLRVPDDISIVGFDDTPDAQTSNPALTTVRQPMREMGARATRMLLARIAGEDPQPPRIELPTELIIRDTCRPTSSAAPTASARGRV